MDISFAHLPAETVVSEQSAFSLYKVPSAASPKQIPSLHIPHDRNYGEQSLGPATLHNTPAHKRGVDTVEGHVYPGVEEGGGTSGTGFPGTVNPSTAPLLPLQARQLDETREHGPPAGRTNSMEGAVGTRSSRSQSREWRASIGSINEEVTGAFSVVYTALLVMTDGFISRHSSIVFR